MAVLKFFGLLYLPISLSQGQILLNYFFFGSYFLVSLVPCNILLNNGHLNLNNLGTLESRISPTPVFVPGKARRPRSLAGCIVHGVAKSQI